MMRSQRTFPKGSQQRSNLQWMLRIIMMSRSSDRAVGTRAPRVLGLLLLNGDGEFLLVGGGEDGEDGSEGIHLECWFGGWREEEKVEALRRVGGRQVEGNLMMSTVPLEQVLYPAQLRYFHHSVNSTGLLEDAVEKDALWYCLEWDVSSVRCHDAHKSMTKRQ
jgi:hypothetical protein